MAYTENISTRSNDYIIDEDDWNALVNNFLALVQGMDDNIILKDNVAAAFGDSSDDTISHDGTDLVIATAAALSLTSGQIKFPATQNASANANTLDDYEEGTFTPGIGDDSVDGSGEGQTYDTQTGFYTKMGNRVFFTARIVLTSLGTLTAGQQARITGLPFTSSSTANSNGQLYVGRAQALSVTAGYSVSGIVTANATDAPLYLWDATTGSTVLLLSELTASGDLFVAGQYQV